MIAWVREHVSMTVWCASFDTPISIGLIGARFTGWPEYSEVEVELLGFGAAVGYWPGGKYLEAQG